MLACAQWDAMLKGKITNLTGLVRACFRAAVSGREAVDTETHKNSSKAASLRIARLLQDCESFFAALQQSSRLCPTDLPSGGVTEINAA